MRGMPAWREMQALNTAVVLLIVATTSFSFGGAYLALDVQHGVSDARARTLIVNTYAQCGSKTGNGHIASGPKRTDCGHPRPNLLNKDRMKATATRYRELLRRSEDALDAISN